MWDLVCMCEPETDPRFQQNHAAHLVALFLFSVLWVAFSSSVCIHLHVLTACPKRSYGAGGQIMCKTNLRLKKLKIMKIMRATGSKCTA